MIITTSQAIEGEKITEYMGVVSAAAVMVMAAGNKGTQRGWQSGVESVTEILKEQASKLGADAIIAVRYEPSGSSICATGTAVKLG